MYYVRWTNEDIKDIHALDLVEVITEIDVTGRIHREIGLNDFGSVVHKHPSDRYKNGKYGVFDSQPVDTHQLESDLDKVQFEELWSR